MIVPTRSVPLVDQGNLTAVHLLNFCFLILGLIISSVIYASIEPVIVGLLFLLAFMLLICAKGIGDREEQRAFLIVYSVGCFWAGISAIYAEVLRDPGQNYNDAGFFFTLSSSGSSRVSLSELVVMTEGSGAILLWQSFYDLFAFLGFEKGRYIGVNINITLVSLTCVLGVKMTRLLYGQDRVRIRRFVRAFSCCGVFWLFAGIHLRDAAVLLGVSLLIYFWVRYLTNPNISNLLRVTAFSVVAFLLFEYLRKEFVFLPLAFVAAAIVALIFGRSAHKNRSPRIVLVGILLCGIIYFGAIEADSFVSALVDGSEGYDALAWSESNSSSLGYNLIVDQHPLIRLISGSIYLYIYPIPFWAGFQLESANQLFKSFHVLSMFGIMPLFVLGVIRIIKVKKLCSVPLLFLLFISVGFTFAVAMTSLEVRHIGVFLPSLLLMAMLPDLTALQVRIAYRKLFLFFLSGIFFIHLIWSGLKIF